jgi:hypothetical protein
MIYRYFLTFVFIAIFVAVCSAQDKPEEKLSPKEAAQDFIKAQEKAEEANATEFDKIDAATMMAVTGETLASQSVAQFKNADLVKELIKEVEELTKKPEGKELSCVKFDLVYKEIEKLKTASEYAIILKNCWEELKKIKEKIREQIDRSKDHIEKKETLIKELEKVENAYKNFVSDLGEYAESKLSGKDDETRKLRKNLDKYIKKFSNEQLELEKALIEKEEKEYLTKALDDLGTRIDSNADETINKLESELQKKPDSVEKWEEITHWRLIKSITMNKTLHGEFEEDVLSPLETALKKPEHKKIEKNLTYLYNYYDGLIWEHCNDLSKAEEAFKQAEENAVSEQDKMKAQCKLLELRTQLVAK